MKLTIQIPTENDPRKQRVFELLIRYGNGSCRMSEPEPIGAAFSIAYETQIPNSSITAICAAMDVMGLIYVL